MKIPNSVQHKRIGFTFDQGTWRVQRKYQTIDLPKHYGVPANSFWDWVEPILNQKLSVKHARLAAKIRRK